MRLGILLLILSTGPLLDAYRRTPLHQAPSGAVTRQNPYDRRADANRAGAKLLQRHCASCHGTKAEGQNHAPALASTEVRNAPPGALFWVLRNGSLRHGMPSFSHLPEPQRWQI